VLRLVQCAALYAGEFLMWEGFYDTAVDLLAAFEANRDALAAGREFSRLPIRNEPLDEATQAAFDRTMAELDLVVERLAASPSA